MISTSSYNNWNSNKYRTYSISGDCGKKAGYNGECFKQLAPKLSFYQVWHDNIGVIDEEENNRYYVEQYYEQVLSKLDPEDIYRKLDGSILLCYEDNKEFCHRHIVAGWLEILLNKEIPEEKAYGYNVEKVERPDYIKEYLESAMRKNRNMRGFNSLRALYLFEKGEKLEEKAAKIKESSSTDPYINIDPFEKAATYREYMQEACYLRCCADEAEEEYNKRRRVKVKE